MVFKEAKFMSTLPGFQVIPLEQIPLEVRSHQDAKELPVVLVVDDERVIADTLSIILARNGFAVHTAYDAASALDVAGVIPPHVLLSDVMMGPGMDGTQLAIEMTRSHPDCKVILFSGHAAVHDLLAKATSQGYRFKLLTKPVHPADLLATIAETLGSFASAASA